MAAGTFTAQMAVSRWTGRWRLYVVLLGKRSSQWPEYEFDGAVVPTVAARSRALNKLGFVFTDGAAWTWVEDSVVADDAASPVLLIASASVREAGP
ncbi:DUF6303 family protein [Streptomyces lavendofoliae]|uniref:DUF6303 family protein n=1 Tax=Streptomyces lavendofoliae TaxID=67314 RepID=UPI003D8B8F27